MFKVRYYEKTFHPDQFTKHGLLGKSIRVINWVRWKLETVNQRLVLRYLCKEGHVDAHVQRTLRERFKVDVEAEKVAKKMTSPNLGTTLPVEVFSSLKEAPPETPGAALDDLSPESQPYRPSRLDELIARYGHNRREKRYVRGRRQMVFEDDAIEPVGPIGEGG